MRIEDYTMLLYRGLIELKVRSGVFLFIPLSATRCSFIFLYTSTLLCLFRWLVLLGT